MTAIRPIDDPKALEVLRERVVEYVRSYLSANKDQPVTMGILGQQFSRSATKLGTTVREIVKADPRFYTVVLPSGATNVTLLE